MANRLLRIRQVSGSTSTPEAGDGRLMITLTRSLEGIWDAELRRRMVYAGEAFAHINVEAHGRDLWIRYGRLNVYPESLAEGPADVRDYVFYHWFVNY